MHSISVFLVVSAILGGAFGSVLQVRQQKEQGFDPFIYENEINETLELLRVLIPETVVVDLLEISPETKFSNVVLQGLNKFHVDSLTVDETTSTFTINLLIPLVASSDYELSLDLGDGFEIQGKGKADIDFIEITLGISNELVLVGTDHINLKNSKITCLISDESKWTITGLLVNGNDISASFDTTAKLLVTYINTHQEALSDLISPILEAAINGLLDGVTIPPDGKPGSASGTTLSLTLFVIAMLSSFYRG